MLKKTLSFDRNLSFVPKKTWLLSEMKSLTNLPQNAFWKVFFHQDVFFKTKFRRPGKRAFFAPPKRLPHEKKSFTKYFGFFQANCAGVGHTPLASLLKVHHEVQKTSLDLRSVLVFRTHSKRQTNRANYLVTNDNLEKTVKKRQVVWIHKQDGRLAPAYFSPNYKYFDQLLQTVKNKTTVLILGFKDFSQTLIWPLISVLYAKAYHDFPSKLFCLTIPKNFVGEPFGVSENFWYRKSLWIRGGKGVSRFSVENFLSHSAEKFRRGTF